jgi:hypothetical protein
VCLEEVRFVAMIHLQFFNPIPRHDPELEEFQCPARVCVCQGCQCVTLPSQLLLLLLLLS